MVPGWNLIFMLFQLKRLTVEKWQIHFTWFWIYRHSYFYQMWHPAPEALLSGPGAPLPLPPAGFPVHICMLCISSGFPREKSSTVPAMTYLHHLLPRCFCHTWLLLGNIPEKQSDFVLVINFIQFNLQHLILGPVCQGRWQPALNGQFLLWIFVAGKWMDVKMSFLAIIPWFMFYKTWHNNLSQCGWLRRELVHWKRTEVLVRKQEWASVIKSFW